MSRFYQPQPRDRVRGRINSSALIALGSLGALAAIVAAMSWNSNPQSSVKSRGGGANGALVVYCAAGIKAPVEAAAKAYEKEFGVPIQLQYGGSGTLLSSIRASNQGDLFVSADRSHIETARRQGLLEESLPLAHQHPVIAVAKGDAKKINSVADLLRGDVRVALANPDAASIGTITRKVLQKSGEWTALEKRAKVFKPTVNDVANDIKIGAVDAGIVWDATARQYPQLQAIHTPAFDQAREQVTVGVLKSSEYATAALRFARYLGAPDKGLAAFKTRGYEVVAGDAWAPSPELHILAGAMLRPAVDATITQFEKREGVSITRVYNGCGILVAQMRAGQRPDAYFACDASFMKQVHDLFLDASTISQNQLVILVPKGNPKGIKTLHDLGKPGFRVGIGHEKLCALGVLTKNTFLQTGTFGTVMKNVKVQSPTGDLLVNQLRTGSLDVVIAYISNLTPAKNQLEAIPISIPCARALQPVAVGRASKYPLLTARLIDALKSAESEARFKAQGFVWKAPEMKAASLKAATG